MDPTPDIPSLRTFDLSSEGGRMAFLWTLWESYQEAGILMAVHHVWDSLAMPRPRRARAMAAALDLPGEGKPALRRVLARFLEEANHEIAMDALPPREDYPDFESWNIAAVAVFARFHAEWEVIARRYEALLDGRPMPRRGTGLPAPGSCSSAAPADRAPGAQVLPWPRRG